MVFFTLKSLTLTLALSLCSGMALAKDVPVLADLPFEQLMQQELVGASKIAQQISSSPSAVAIVTAADIRAYGYRTIADVINSMRGLYTTYDRRYQYMGGRGFGAPEDYAGRIMLLIDGYATQESLFNQAYIDESGLIDLALVERVEYVPGTGSVTYGNNALLGIINIVTRQGRDVNATQLSGEVSSNGGKKQRFTFGKQLDNGAGVLLSASAFDSEGQNLYFPAYDTPQTNQGLAQNQDSERARRIFGKYTFEGLTVEGAYVDREKMVPTNPNPYTAFNRPFSIQDENAFLNIRYETDIGLKLHSASRLYQGAYAYNATREFADDSDGEKYGLRQFEGRWWGLEQKFVGNWFTDHAIVFGLEYRNDYQQDFHWSYQNAAGQIVRTEQEFWSRQTTSLYLTDEYRLSEQWSFNLGARYDKASDLTGNWSPRLAAIYRPDAKTTLKASYSEAFRMPNAYERFYYGTAAAPERVAATELVLQHEFSPRLRLTGSLYHYRRTQQLQFSDALDDYVADGTSHTRGLELELERSWENGMRARGSAAFQHASDITGADLANSPNTLVKLNLSFPVYADSLRVGMEAQYLGSRLTLERRPLPGVALANLTFSSERKWHGLSASMSIRNLFNRAYDVVSPFDWRPDSGLPQDTLRMDGRTFWFQLNYDL